MQKRKVICPHHRKKTQNRTMRYAMRATAVFVPFFQGLNTGAYRISMAVQKDHMRLSSCHRCIQRFVPHASFMYAFSKDAENYSGRESDPRVLQMYADITDDIPYTYIEQSCFRGRKICSNLISYPGDFLPEIDKKLKNISKKTVGGSHESSEASKGIRLFGFDLNMRVRDTANNKEMQSSGLSSKKYCLLLEEYIPDLWILGCLRCLAPGEKDERYLIPEPSLRYHQWVLRYTTFESQKDTMHRCGYSCGTIRWGSKIHCRVTPVDTLTQGVSSYISNFAVYHDTELKRKNSEPNKQICVSCAQSTIDHHADHIKTSLNKQNDPRSSIQKGKQIFSNFSDSKSFHHTARESGATSSIQKWSSPYHCVHHSFALNYRLEYKELVDTSSKKKSESQSMATCSRCLMSTVDSVVIKNALKNSRLTSRRSALLFFSSSLDVRSFAIRCVKMCKFFNGLTEDVCHFLWEKEKLLPETKAPSVTESRIIDGKNQGNLSLIEDHSLPSLLRQKNREAIFRSAISHLESNPSDSVWYFEFDIVEGERMGHSETWRFALQQ